MLRHPKAPEPKHENDLSSIAEGQLVYQQETTQQLKDCQQERDQLRIQIATYRDALDRLGQRGGGVIVNE